MRFSILLATSTFLLSQSISADTYTADVWADNWFQFNINGELVAEDSVSITTERSFNAESFTFEATPPFVIGMIVKDFKENDSGLEYIGSKKQQMGDGGVIAQIKNSHGELVAVTNENWRCLVIHEAPLDKRCADEKEPVAGVGHCGFAAIAAPAEWDLPGYDDIKWNKASVYSAQEVRPKGGYDRINWDKEAELIWGPDLETNNTLLCRLSVN